MPKRIREEFAQRRWVLPLHVLVVAAAALALYAKRAGFGVPSDVLVAFFGVATVCIAYLGGLLHGLIASAIGVAVIGIALSTPHAPFVFPRAEDRITLLSMLVAYPTVTFLVRAMRARSDAMHEQLKEAEQLWKLLAAHVPGTLATLSSDGRIYFVNRPLPWLPADVDPVGDAIANILPERLRAQVEKALPKIWSSGERYRTEAAFNGPDGRSYLFDIRIERVLRDNDALAMLATFIDVTDRLTQEDAHARLAMVVHASNAAIFGATLDGIITSWNPAARRIYGHSTEEIVGKPFSTLFPEGRSFEEAAPFLEAAAKGEVIERAEIANRKKDGTPLVVSLSVSPIVHHGSVTGIAVIARDLSEQRREAEERRRTLALLAEAERVAHVGGWEWDLSHDSMTWSDELYRIYGYGPGSVRPSLDAYLRPVEPTDREMVHKAISAARHEGKEFAFDHRILRDDGAVRTLRVHGAPFLDASGKATRLIGSVHDVTEQRALESELAAKQRALENEVARRTSQLHDSEEKLHAVLDGAPIALWATDANGIFTLSEGHGLAAMGLTPGTVVGKSLFDMYKDEPHILDNARRTLKGETVHASVLVRGRRYESTQAPIRSKDGTVIGMTGVAVDMTEATPR